MRDYLITYLSLHDLFFCKTFIFCQYELGVHNDKVVDADMQFFNVVKGKNIAYSLAKKDGSNKYGVDSMAGKVKFKDCQYLFKGVRTLRALIH